MTTSNDDIAYRLARRGRPLDPHFADDEPLYRRFRSEQKAHGQLTAEVIRLPDYSVNRGKYSEPADALWPDWSQDGVAAFAVEDATGQGAGEGGTEFDFRIRHAPIEQNYAHSEVIAYRRGEDSPARRVSHTAKRRYRERLIKAAKIVIEPAR